MLSIYLLCAWGTMAGAMTIAWCLQRILRNASWVDAVWSYGLGLAGVLCAQLGPRPDSPRHWLVSGLMAAWALRLGTHLSLRSARGIEDARYARLRVEWGEAFEPRMFGLLQIQAVAGAALCAAVWLAAHNPAPLGRLDGVALVLLVASLLGEATADAQLGAFANDSANAGNVCHRGLWRYSRHPNYFFEWLFWLALAVSAVQPGDIKPQSWLAFISPAAMYWLLVHVSGIPPLERHMMATRGQAYLDYQRRTSPFWPLPARESDRHGSSPSIGGAG